MCVTACCCTAQHTRSIWLVVLLLLLSPLPPYTWRGACRGRNAARLLLLLLVAPLLLLLLAHECPGGHAPCAACQVVEPRNSCSLKVLYTDIDKDSGGTSRRVPGATHVST